MLVSINEFKSHLSRYVSEAQAGQSIELTSHRKVVARLVGIPPSEGDGISRLLTQGIATWQGGKPVGAELRLSERGKPVSAQVMEDRG
ncbi:MAG: type II toxin-antitoxin system prevent-host-death family antitoxin [Burkholderiales bacterium]|nr:type II toxin-antitoxin system prevent-host-death family antitoxin [Burkholderiales bacterium]